MHAVVCAYYGNAYLLMVTTVFHRIDQVLHAAIHTCYHMYTYTNIQGLRYDVMTDARTADASVLNWQGQTRECNAEYWPSDIINT
eukprot:7918601-Pyramimonas_sp.AAC.1